MEYPPDTPSCSSGILSPITSPPNWISSASTSPIDGSVATCYECLYENCGKSFRRPSDLAKHQKYHVKDYQCSHQGCDKLFSTTKDLKRHVVTHKRDELGGRLGQRCKFIACRKAQTGHVYTRKDNYIRHLRTAHPDVDIPLHLKGLDPAFLQT